MHNAKEMVRNKRSGQNQKSAFTDLSSSTRIEAFLTIQVQVGGR